MNRIHPLSAFSLNYQTQCPDLHPEADPIPRSSEPGVMWQRKSSKWRAVLRKGAQRICLGSYANEADAIAAARKAREQ